MLNAGKEESKLLLHYFLNNFSQESQPLMIKRILVVSIVLFIHSCSSKKENTILAKTKTVSDSVNSTSFDSSSRWLVQPLAVYADTKVEAFNLDSIIANVTFINKGNESIWLYKPILPTDSLVERSFMFWGEEDLHWVNTINRKTNHKYLSGTSDWLNVIIPSVNRSSQLELLPGTETTFKMNLCKLYDFRKLNYKRPKKIVIFYEMMFPYIKEEKQLLLPDTSDNEILKPVYFTVYPEKYDGKKYDSFATKFILPVK